MKKLIERAKQEIKPDTDIIVLTIVASVLATYGIVLNDNFILLASMLVAPFFDPIIAVLIFTIGKKWKYVFKGIRTLLLITILGLIFSGITSYFLSFDHNLFTAEYSSNIQFEYFLITLLLGAVGMLLWIWPKMSNTSAGLAIAISLMPPLANIARTIILQDWENTITSITAFFMNIVGILIGGMIVIFIKKKERY